METLIEINQYILIFIVVLSIVIAIIYCIYHIDNLWNIKKFNNRSKYFSVGDSIALKDTATDNFSEKLSHCGKEYALLEGWHPDYIIFSISNQTYKRSWSVLNYNKSAEWLKYYEECKFYMKKDPGFDFRVYEENSTNNITARSGELVNDKPIELLNETECQVFLRIALEEQDFRKAELIKKRLENFR